MWNPRFIRCCLWFLRSDEHHLQHARWIQEEMPVRLAHRLSDFLQLPFVIVCNARFHEVHGSIIAGEQRKLLTNHWFLWFRCFKGRAKKSYDELSCMVFNFEPNFGWQVLFSLWKPMFGENAGYFPYKFGPSFFFRLLKPRVSPWRKNFRMFFFGKVFRLFLHAFDTLVESPPVTRLPEMVTNGWQRATRRKRERPQQSRLKAYRKKKLHRNWNVIFGAM